MTVESLVEEISGKAGEDSEFSAEEVEAAAEIQLFDGALRSEQWLRFCSDQLEKDLSPDEKELWSALLDCFEQVGGARHLLFPPLFINLSVHMSLSICRSSLKRGVLFALPRRTPGSAGRRLANL